MHNDNPQHAVQELGDAPTTGPSVPEPGGRRVWPVFVAFFVVLTGVLVGSFVLVVALTLVQEGGRPLSQEEAQSRLSEVALSPPALIGSVGLSVLLLTTSSLVGGALSRQPVVDRLRLRRSDTRLVAYPLAALGLFAVGQSAESAAILLGAREAMSGLRALAEAVGSMPLNVFVVFVTVGSLGAGLAEELFFRGYMQTRLTTRWGVVTGVAISAVAFGVLHLDPMHASLAFFMGLYLGWLAELSGSVVLPIVAHAVNNLAAFTLMRVLEDTGDGAPMAFLLVSVMVAGACVLLLIRFVPRAEASREASRPEAAEGLS
jgi:membrane protease YdiL (CAAX protease family)